MPVRIFKHYVQLPVLLLAVFEGLLLVGAVYGGAWIRFSGDIHEVGAPYVKPFVFAVVVMLSMIAMGLYQTRAYPQKVGMLIRLAASFLLAAVLLALLFYVLPGLYLGRGALMVSLVTGLVGVSAVRLVFHSVVGDSFFRPRVLVYGAGEKAANLISLTGSADMRRSNVIGFVRSKGDIETRIEPDRIVDYPNRLADYARSQEVDEIVVAIDDRRRGLPIQELLDCKLGGIQVSDALTYFERETGKVKLDLLYPSWMIFSEGFNKNRLVSIAERVFDIMASLVLLLVTWPLMLLVAIAIFVDDGFPVLYRQARVGFQGRVFEVLKFRSMRVDAEKDGVAKWAEANDRRITRVGRTIRKFRFDELPQIINVLRGDMSFVGPRPERPDFVDQLSQRIPYYRERHCVKPGITGWAQLKYEYGASQQDALEKLQYDLYYVKNRTLLLDMMILLQTAEVVLWRTGAR
ncbi:MAG: TIGR03013 family PEP-CTERM/XrtA system glycosyltransferase [Gammaproteobacteria bacterium]|nr:TIGR03013 family PEP-CTERM/XrtA system glycosyltransferase [Gammaproteobacteria bacterium]NNF59902.1 TIGR03013 family PEP-CTERM/XrtA system glycosyltransferase [Gammaproteobacteria bacterium]NNM21636.1 TIGR03013 family PEP-CTERM/XrtA system glycosyltransferase [Gammaproteobacteria bacterium]